MVGVRAAARKAMKAGSKPGSVVVAASRRAGTTAGRVAVRSAHWFRGYWDRVDTFRACGRSTGTVPRPAPSRRTATTAPAGPCRHAEFTRSGRLHRQACGVTGAVVRIVSVAASGAMRASWTTLAQHRVAIVHTNRAASAAWVASPQKAMFDQRLGPMVGGVGGRSRSAMDDALARTRRLAVADARAVLRTRWTAWTARPHRRPDSAAEDQE